MTTERLTMGIDSPTPTAAEKALRVKTLNESVMRYLPELYKIGLEAKTGGSKAPNAIVLHQDAFAAGLDKDEYTLLGMAIKFLGMHGLNVSIVAKKSR